MQAAIVTLEISLSGLENNERVHRTAGNVEQADMDSSRAAQIRQALAVLRAACTGPIWPGPQGQQS